MSSRMIMDTTIIASTRTTTAATLFRNQEADRREQALGLGEAEVGGRFSTHRRGRRKDSRPAADEGPLPRSRRGGFHRGHRRRRASRWRCSASRACSRRRCVEGIGWVNCAHGRFPIPAPATLAILGARGIGVTQCDEPHELVTPTGAALLAEFVEEFGPMQDLVAEKIGFGLGTRDNKTRPNVLRAVLGG